MALDTQNLLDEKAFNSQFSENQFTENTAQFNQLEYTTDALDNLSMFNQGALAELGSSVDFEEGLQQSPQLETPEQTTADTTIAPGKRSRQEIINENKKIESEIKATAKWMSANEKAIWYSNINPNLAMTSYKFDRYKSNIDRYLGYGKSTFNKLGFNPLEDNEAYYNANTTALQDFTRMLSTTGTLFSTGFMSNYRTIGNFFSGKSRELFDADEVLAREYERANAIGSSSKSGPMAFTNNLLLQLSYSLGIVVNVAAEELALWGGAALTSGFTGGGSLAAAGTAQLGMNARNAFRLRQAWNAVGSATRVAQSGTMLKGGYQMLKAFKHVDDSRQLWQSMRAAAGTIGRGAVSFVNPLTHTTNLYNVEKSTAAYKNLSNLAKVSKGFGAFYRDTRAMGFAYSEADLEGGMVYNKRVDENIEIFKEKNGGRMPSTKEEWQDIYTNAQAASKLDAQINLPLIFLSNKITFDALFNFKGLKHFTNAADDFVENSKNAKGFLWNRKTRSIKDVGQGLAGEFKTAFSSFKYPKIYTGMALNYIKANAMEGFQELAQEVTSGSINKYYGDVYKNPMHGGFEFGKTAFISSLGEDVFSMKGLETFAMGALMAGPQTMIQKGALGMLKLFPKIGTYMMEGKEAYQNKYVKPKQQARAELAKVANTILSDLDTYFSDRKESMHEQRVASENMAEALINDDDYTFYNSKDQLTMSNVLFSLKNGTFGLVNDALNDMSNLTDKELAEAFNLPDATKAREKLQEYQKRASQIKEKFDYANKNFQSPFNPGAYKKSADTQGYIREFIAHKAFEDAKKAFIFSQYGMERAVERMASMFEDFNSFAPTSNMSATDLTILQSADGIKKEIKLLKDEAEALNASTDPKSKALAKDKESKLASLTEYLDALNEYELNKVDDVLDNNGRYSTPENAEIIDKLYAAYGKYIESVAKINGGGFTQQDKVLSSFRKMLDYYHLDTDAKKFNKLTNALLDPNNLLRYADRIQNALVELYDNRDQVTGEAFDSYFRAQEFNALVNQLGKINIVINPEEVEEFYRNGTIPKTFFDLNKETIVTEADPRFNAIKSMVEIYRDALLKDREEKARREEERIKAAATPADETVVTETTEEEIPEVSGVKTEIEVIDEEIEKLLNEFAQIQDEEGNPRRDEITAQLDDLQERRERLVSDSKKEEVVETPEDTTKVEEQPEVTLVVEPQVINNETFEGTLSETDDSFIQEYNDVNAKLAAIIKDEKSTPDEIKTGFTNLLKVVNKLEKEARNKYIKKINEDRARTIASISNNQKATDVEKPKRLITDLFSKKSTFGNIVSQVFDYINNQLGRDKKDEVISHFEKEYLKAVDEKIEKLNKNASSIKKSGTALDRLISVKNKFKKSILDNIELLKTKSDELKAKTSNIDLGVESPDSFNNPINKSILSDKDGPMSRGQEIAINDFIRTGILKQEEFDAIDKSKHEASELINEAVGRVYTWDINGALFAFYENGNIKDLKDYLKVFASNIPTISEAMLNEAYEYIDNGLEQLKKIDPTPADLLKELSEIFSIKIPQTPDLTKEQRQLLKNYKFAIYNIISDGNTLSLLDDLDVIKNDVFTGKIELNADSIFPDEQLSKFKKYFKQAAKTDKEFLSKFKDAFIDKMTKLDPSSDYLKEVVPALNDLVDKYFDKYNKNIADAKSLLQAFMTHGIELMGMYETGEGGVKKLSDDEMSAIIEGEANDVLTEEQINQVSEFAKGKKLDEYKRKLNAAVGYQIAPPVYDAMMLELAPKIQSISFSSLRQKSAEDLRTVEDLAKALTVTPDGKVSVKTALQMIIDSEHSTEAEKELARQLLPTVFDGATFTVNNNLEVPGQFDPETGKVEINLNFAGYNTSSPSIPIETVILHELLHQKIEKEIANDSSDFAKGIRAVFNAVKNEKGAKTFYAFQDSLQTDEQLREFVIEALTNPSFQYLLAKTEYKNTTKSVWETLVQILTNLLSGLGVNVSNTALSEVLGLTSNLISPVTIQTAAEPSVTETFMEKIKNANNITQLTEIFNELKQEKPTIENSLYKSLLAHLQGKIKTLKAKQISEKIKGFKSIQHQGKTYYYGIDNNKFAAFRKTRNGFIPVRTEPLTHSILLDLINKGDKEILSLLSKDLTDDILNVTGKPTTRGTYASGDLSDSSQSYGEEVHAKALAYPASLRFKSIQDLDKFESIFWKKKKVGKKFIYKKNLNRDTVAELKEKFGETVFKDYSELAYKYDRDGIRLLLKNGILDVDPKGESIFENQGADESSEYPSPEDHFSLYDDILAGKNLDSNDYKDIQEYVNNRLSKYFGIKVPMSLQRQLEDVIFRSKLDFDPTEFEETDLDVPTPAITITSDLKDKDYVENFDDIDFRTVSRESSSGAMQPYGLRSYMWDFRVENGEIVEHDSFKKYYYKIRGIINKLSTKDAEVFKDRYVTLDKDNANLRWDGSTKEPNWAKYSKEGIVGYISDEAGNPIVFNKEGEEVGKLDRNNLSDKKGLDNGENQIVYFSTVTENSKPDILQKMEQQSLKQMFEARKEVMAGNPQIARIQRITPGQLSTKELVKVTPTNIKNTARDTDIQEALLTQDNVSFDISGGNLSAVLSNVDGIKNNIILFPPNTRYISIELSNGEKLSLADYLMELLKVYNQLEIDNDPKAELVKNNLVNFIRNLWYTGQNQGLTFPQSLKSVGVGAKDSNNIWNYATLSAIDIVDGQAVINTTNANQIKNAVNQKRINVNKKWLTGEIPFEFPVITEVNGKKTINFVEKSYKEFLIKDVGMTTYATEIPTAENLKAYHSQVHFTNPTSLSKKPAAEASVKESQLVNDPNSVVKKTQNDVKEATPSKEAPKRVPKKLNAPFYNFIYQKKCK